MGRRDSGDRHDDLLLYSLSGPDAASFIDRQTTGQIKTKVKLDYETKDEYMVMVTATDPSGATDSIMVTIMVTDGPDKAVITGVKRDYARTARTRWRRSARRTRTVTPSCGPWAETDMGDFTIDGGVLTFKSAPDYEDPTAEADWYAWRTERLQGDGTGQRGAKRR